MGNQKNKDGRSHAIRRAVPFYCMLAPFAVIFLIFMVLPILMSVFLSLTDFNMLQTPGFVGFNNYIRLFFDDAVLVSRELELTLTGRDCGLDERAPMCGVPHHSSEIYIKRLIDKGYKVAICEQVAMPDGSKTGFDRKLVRVVTPATVVEGSMLDEDKNNYICSVYYNKTAAGLCFADVTTGALMVCELKGAGVSLKMINEMARFLPREIVFNKALFSCSEVGDFMKQRLNCLADLVDDEAFSREEAVESHFGKTLEQLNLLSGAESTKALSGLLVYLKNNHPKISLRLKEIDFYQEEKFLNLNLSARRNLELVRKSSDGDKRGSLLWVLDQTKTAMGKRLLRSVIERPLMNPAAITKRHAAVSELVSNPELCGELAEQLGEIYDMERLLTRVMFESVGPRELCSLAFTAAKLPAVKELTAGCKSNALAEAHRNIDTLEDIRNLIINAIEEEPPVSLKDGFVIKTGFNAQLDELRAMVTGGKDYLEKLEAAEKEKTGIKTLKVGYNKVFGYYIEVTRMYADAVPAHYIRKQTLANCERYITEELKEIESKLLSAGDRMIALEHEIFAEVRKFVAAHVDRIQTTAGAIAWMDLYCSLAVVATRNKYTCPDINMSDQIIIHGGRHPVVEKMLKDGLFVPNDTVIDCKSNQVAVITGPNMAGKSTYMRQVALIVLMAQMGSFVPAESASIGIVDGIFTRIGAHDDLATGQSTFLVEMNEVADILKHATKNSLVILDEIGRGTSTFDGMSIAKAVIEYICKSKKLGCKTMFATHYHELTALEQEFDSVRNYNIAAKKRGDEITFLRKIIEGAADDSYGIEVAKLAGVPESVIERAKAILAQLEENSGRPAAQVKSSEEQIHFAVEDGSPVVRRLKALDVNHLTPMEALGILYELKAGLE